MKTKIIKCNFCGKTQFQVNKIIKGKNACICNECIFVGFQIIIFPDKLKMAARIEALESKVEQIKKVRK